MLNNILSRLHKFCEIKRCTCWASVYRLRSCCRYWRWITGRDSWWIIRTCWKGDVWRVGMGKDRYAYIFFRIGNKKAYVLNIIVGIRFISLVLASNLWVIIVFVILTVLRKFLSGERFLSGHKRAFISSFIKMFPDQQF